MSLAFQCRVFQQCYKLTFPGLDTTNNSQHRVASTCSIILWAVWLAASLTVVRCMFDGWWLMVDVCVCVVRRLECARPVTTFWCFWLVSETAVLSLVLASASRAGPALASRAVGISDSTSSPFSTMELPQRFFGVLFVSVLKWSVR